MIKYLLDTNICIYLIKHQPPEVMERFRQYHRGEIAVSSITWAELCCGISRDGKEAIATLRTLLEVIPFDAAAGMIFGELTLAHPNRKANFDRMIAAHAIALEVPLVTNNEGDFSMYARRGLVLENWVKNA